MAFPAVLTAQTAADSSPALQAVAGRLDRLEQQNKELTAEIAELRAELSAARSGPPVENRVALEDRVAVVENRVEEQAQSKVEASQRFPLSVNGMLLFNAFTNGQAGANSGYYSSLLGSPERTGATIGQTLLGVNFDGPEVAGGKISGSLNMDFLGGTSGYGYALRIRRGVVNLDWANRSVTVGEDKPLISQRAPESLAEVAYPALADAGNPWIWVPQVRYTEHLRVGDSAGIDVGVSELETDEAAGFPAGMQPYSLELARPALESRVNFWTQAGGARFEVAPGFHVSDSHVGGFTVPSRFATVDWLVRPARWLEFTGFVAGGRNMAVLGGFTDGFTLSYSGPPIAVQTVGGWAQTAFHLNARLTLNAFGGLQAPRIGELGPGALTHKTQYAANLIYRFGPNILLGAEALQDRAGYLGQPHAIRNHYDLAIGYLF